MSMPAIQRHWTVADVHALPDDGQRYEVIDGELFVTPAPSWHHQDALLEMAARLRDYLSREPVGHVFVAPAVVVLSAKRGIQPDVFVTPLVNGRRPEAWSDVGRLLLAIEILSPSTARADRVVKRALFRDEGVPEYWIVDLDARTIERSTPADARVDVLADELTWRPEGAASPLVIDLPEYFARISG